MTCAKGLHFSAFNSNGKPKNINNTYTCRCTYLQKDNDMHKELHVFIKYKTKEQKNYYLKCVTNNAKMMF